VVNQGRLGEQAQFFRRRVDLVGVEGEHALAAAVFIVPIAGGHTRGQPLSPLQGAEMEGAVEARLAAQGESAPVVADLRARHPAVLVILDGGVDESIGNVEVVGIARHSETVLRRDAVIAPGGPGAVIVVKAVAAHVKEGVVQGRPAEPPLVDELVMGLGKILDLFGPADRIVPPHFAVAQGRGRHPVIGEVVGDRAAV